ncbi:MAG TPA: thiol peroxidase [Microvirga sp.]|nr:thiol peroxidase [Microvirga sp.]
MQQVEERTGAAFEFAGRLTVAGRTLRAGDPDFPLERFEGAMRRVRLQDGAGTARRLDAAASLGTPVRRDALRANGPDGLTVCTAGMGLPFAPGRRNAAEGVGHPALPAHKGEAFGRDGGMLLEESRLWPQAVFVIDRADRIAYAESVPEQRPMQEPMQEPDDVAAAAAARRAAQA